MKIVDFEKKGNVVRFYCGKDDCKDYYGDDWDDAPYDCNAGTVYDEFVIAHVDIAFPFDYMVLEPCDGCRDWNNCTKDDMKEQRVPCVIAVPATTYKGSYYDTNFSTWVGSRGIKKFYFGDNMNSYEPNSLVVWGELKKGNE